MAVSKNFKAVGSSIINFNIVKENDKFDIIQVEKSLKDITRDFMLEVMDEAQLLCPVDTGFMKSTGQLLESTNSWEIMYEASYAKYVIGNYDWITEALNIVATRRNMFK